MSHVISSSYNHFIIMRTHRWPYGPCFNIFEQIIVEAGILDESRVITSSYNHFIIMRTHRWPHGPCCIDQYDTRHDFQKCQSTTEAHFDFAGPYRKKAYLNGIWRKLMSSLNQIKFEDKSYILAIEMRVRISGASGNELKRIRCSL